MKEAEAWFAVKPTKAANVIPLTVRFKGVTYECLNDPELIARARDAFPDLQLHGEYLAAREKPTLPTR